MSCSEHEIDISVVSSPEASPTNCGQESRSQSPTIRLNTKTNVQSLNYGKFSLIDSRISKSETKHAVSSTSAVLHHTLQNHLNSLNVGLHSFNNLAYSSQHAQHSVIPAPGIYSSVIHSENLCKAATVVDCTSALSQNSSSPTEEYKSYLDSDNNNETTQNNNDNLNSSLVPKSTSELCNLNQKATTSNGFTSFSISSILNRAEPSRKNNSHSASSNTPATELPTAQITSGNQHDAAMLSR